jgi:hypothetical protein
MKLIVCDGFCCLQKAGYSPEELQEKRAELMKQHEQELAELDRKQASEKSSVEQGALADWELSFAKAKLALKERHYKVRNCFG